MNPISLALEDDLSEHMLRLVLQTRAVHYHVGPVFKKNGYGYLKKQCRAFNNLAKGIPVLMLTDLDKAPCPLVLIHDWMGGPIHQRFLFRIAVRELEAWLLANDSEFRSFLGLRKFLTFLEPETLPDPKATLLELASRSPRRDLREGLTRRDSSGNLKQGPGYNLLLAEFLNTLPSFKRSTERCPSFKRLLIVLDRLEGRVDTTQTKTDL